MGIWTRHCRTLVVGLWLPVAVLALSSCQRNSDAVSGTFYDLRFELARTPNTKLADAGDSYCVWAYDSSTRNPELEQAALVRQSVLWYPEQGYRWNAVKALDFYAASPCDLARLDPDSGICFESFSLPDAPDLLYIDPILNLRNIYSLGVVSLEFKSALSLLRVQVQSRCADGTRIEVKKLIVDGLALEGSFHSLPWAEWKVKGERGALTSFDGSHQVSEENAVLCEQRVIPQTAQMNFKLVCDFDIDGVLLRDQELSSSYMLSMRPGKLYELSLCVYENFSMKIEKI